MEIFPNICKHYSPEFLLDICVKFLVEHLEVFTVGNAERTLKNTFLLKDGVSLAEKLCEKMLHFWRDEVNSIACDDFLRLFSDPARTRLCRVDLRDSLVSDVGMEIILKHPVEELDISSCPKLTHQTLNLLNKLKPNLTSLIIGDTVQIFPRSLQSNDQEKQTDTILALPTLRKLVIRDFMIPEEANYCKCLLEPLRNLRCLDLSSCTNLGDLSYLCCFNNLASLTLYNVPHVEDMVPSLCQLTSLVHLDLSQSCPSNGAFENPDDTLEKLVISLPGLMHLDISGTNLSGCCSGELDLIEKIPILGLRKRMERPLEFLGLFYSAHLACYRRYLPAKRIAGEGNEEQLIIAAEANFQKPEMLISILYELVALSEMLYIENTAKVLDITVAIMKRYSRNRIIQVNGSALINALVQADEYQLAFNIGMKKKLIKLILDTAKCYLNDKKLMKNVYNFFLSSVIQIPDDVLFVYDRLFETLLTTVADDRHDYELHFRSILLLNDMLDHKEYWNMYITDGGRAIKPVFNLIRRLLKQNKYNGTMELSWRLIRYVTLASPDNCIRFIHSGGADLFVKCCKQFPEQLELYKNMILLFSNLVRIPHIRPMLLIDDYVTVFCNLLDSKHLGMDVRYYAACILSYLALISPEQWDKNKITIGQSTVLRNLISAIAGWNVMVQRSIIDVPLSLDLKLLEADDTPPAVKHWVVWTVANLTLSDDYLRNITCPLLLKMNGMKLLEDLIGQPQINECTKDLIVLILKQCQRYQEIEDYTNESEQHRGDIRLCDLDEALKL